MVPNTKPFPAIKTRSARGPSVPTIGSWLQARLMARPKIWSTKEGALVATLAGHDRPLTDIAFSHDGKSLVTTSNDGTARIWNVTGANERIVLRGHDGSVTNAIFSPSLMIAMS